MGLLDKLKKENSLKEFISNEIEFIENNVISNSKLLKEVSTLKKLYNENTISSLESAKKLLTNKINYPYEEFPTYDSTNRFEGYHLTLKIMKLNLKEHILLEKNLEPIISKIKDLTNDYSLQKKMKDNNKPNYLLYLGFIVILIISFIIMKWWWNYNMYETVYFTTNDGRTLSYERIKFGWYPLIKLFRLIIFLISGALSSYLGFLTLENFYKSRDYYNYEKITSIIKQKENELNHYGLKVHRLGKD